MGGNADDEHYELSSSEDSTLEPLLPFVEHTTPSLKARLRRHIPIRISGLLHNILLVLSGFLLATVIFFGFDYRPSNFTPASNNAVLSLDSVIRGPPTLSFRDNLRNDTKYMTTWADSGWTNDVMTYFNMIYLALITKAIPVLPPFHPSHVGREAGYIDFATVFDLQRLSTAINIPVLEWNQVKALESDVVEELGCWTLWSGIKSENPAPRSHELPIHLGLDVSYTNIPESVRLRQDLPHDLHLSFWGVASITYPDEYNKVLEDNPVTWPSEMNNHTLPPDQQMICYDLTYYLGAANTYEYEYDYAPAWQEVGRHTRWAPDLRSLADQMLRRAFGLEGNAIVPPYIGMHIRHADFKKGCHGIPDDECFAPLSAYARRVSEINAELIAQPHPLLVQYASSTGTSLDNFKLPVVVTSDESDPEWWEEIRQQGWTWVDHTAASENTEAVYGKWYPALLDAVFQSSGIGFVGTAKSTMSLLAMRRVQDWDGGVGVMVKWGKKDADAH